ncbi:MAG: FHA domain-containing protein, partial [Bdellovibrionales bacterium]|nr:FHA domain-containing protein [Bdellovibrionales bacterium]
QMAGDRLQLGRAEDNDIIIKDNKCSRYHAVLEMREHGLVIKNISTNNRVFVDGMEVSETLLQPNATIKLGDTEIQLFVSGLEALSVNPESPLDIPSPMPTAAKKKNSLFYVYIAIAGLGLYLLLSDDKSAVVDTSLNDDSKIQTEIMEAQKITEQLQNLKYSSGKDSKQYLDAQEEYQKGFRDYREGNYSRAITSFQAALALYPKHELAKKYEILSRRKLDESIQASMQDGNRYMEQGRYNEAISSYRNVMILIKSPDNLTYKEAKAKFDQARAIIEGDF